MPGSASWARGGSRTPSTSWPTPGDNAAAAAPPGIGLEKMNHPCEHEGCTEANATLPCYYPDYEGPYDYDHASLWLCAAHAQEEGFCWGCGQFWAGIESFDFDPAGLCDNCRDEHDSDEERFDDDDLGYSD